MVSEIRGLGSRTILALKKKRWEGAPNHNHLSPFLAACILFLFFRGKSAEILSCFDMFYRGNGGEAVWEDE
jgi:hypothetical protein